MASVRQIVTSNENPLLQSEKTESEEEQQVKELDNERDDLAKQKSQSIIPQLQEDVPFVNASITKADLETWKRLKLSGEPRYGFCLWTGLGSMFSSPQSAVCACDFKLEDVLLTTSPYLFQFSGGVQKSVQTCLSVMKWKYLHHLEHYSSFTVTFLDTLNAISKKSLLSRGWISFKAAWS